MDRLAGLCSALSIKGFSRIRQNLSPEIELVHCKNLEDALSLKHTIGFFLHNNLNLPVELRSSAVLYAMQSIVNLVKSNLKMQNSLLRYPFRAIWTNSNTAAQDLNAIGIAAIPMYRPNRINIPKTPLPKAKHKKILWSYIDSVSVFQNRKDIIIEMMRQLSDVEILIIPDKYPPADLPNVRALGKVNISEIISEVHGIVRISERLDFGRSTFDLLANGRWALYMDMNEKYIYSVPFPDAVPDRIRYLIDYDNDAMRLLRWQYIRDNFNETAIRRRWVSKIKELFNIGVNDGIVSR